MSQERCIISGYYDVFVYSISYLMFLDVHRTLMSVNFNLTVGEASYSAGR
jgi:hypothetical protein